jgi:hypothetical protein
VVGVEIAGGTTEFGGEWDVLELVCLVLEAFDKDVEFFA